MFVIKRRQRQNTWCSSLFPKKAFLRWKTFFLIKSSLTAGKVVFLSVSCEIFWKLCFSYWVLPLNSKFRKVKVVCSDKVLMIFWCWVLIAFPNLSSFEPGEEKERESWCTKWRLILDFFSFFSIWICFVPGFISRVFLSSYVYKEPEDHQNGFCILYYLGRIC